MTKLKFLRGNQSCKTVHTVFLPILRVDILKFNCLSINIAQTKNERFHRKWNSAEICLSWLRVDCEGFFECNKEKILVHLVPQTQEKGAKLVKFTKN